MDKLGRKFFLCLSMILSGAAAFLIYLITSSTIYLVISCVFGAVSTMGFNSLDCLSKASLEFCDGGLTDVNMIRRGGLPDSPQIHSNGRDAGSCQTRSHRRE